MTEFDDATALIAAFRNGQRDPAEVVRAHLERIARRNPALNAFSAISSTALEEARASALRWKAGSPLGPLDGVPIIIKDNLVSRGLPAAWGNAELARRIPDHDELPVAALRQAGAIVLGKGNTPEFAVEGYTGNLTFGVTGNPYDLALTPGGSSGGVVAAVAAGMAVAGLGTDGGGSIRRPVAYTGLWGLKPGIGCLQRGGGLPQVLLDFETVGPVARSARDLALFHGVLAGQVPSLTSGPGRILAVARINGAPCDRRIQAKFRETILRLRALGHEVCEGDLPVDLDPLNEVWPGMVETGLAHLATQEPAVIAASAQKYRDMAERGAAHTGADLYHALTRVFALREAVRGLWGFDAILMPAAASLPWPSGEVFPDRIDGQEVGPRGHAVYTGWVNAAGLPALAFPVGQADGLPVGMQLIAGRSQEAALLGLALQLAQDFSPPPLAACDFALGASSRPG